MSRSETLQSNITKSITQVIGSEEPIEINYGKKNRNNDDDKENNGKGATIKRNLRLPPSCKKRGIKFNVSHRRNPGHFSGPRRS